MAVTVTNRIEQLSTGSTLTPQFLYQSRSIGIVWMIAHQHVRIFECKHIRPFMLMLAIEYPQDSTARLQQSTTTVMQQLEQHLSHG